MKKIIILIFILIILSCNSVKEPQRVIPLWYSNIEEFTSNDAILYKSSGLSYEQIEDDISNKSRDLNNYIKPVKIREYKDPTGTIYALFSIDKYDLSIIFSKEISDEISIVNNLVEKGNISEFILDKIKYYKEAQDLINSYNKYIDLADKYNINLNVKERYTKNRLDILVKEISNAVSVSLNINGDYNNIIYNKISKIISDNGFVISSQGTIVFKADLQTKLVDLDNNYINRVWTLTIKLQDIYGNDINSLAFTGRESHIDDESLQYQIAIIASDKISSELSKLLNY